MTSIIDNQTLMFGNSLDVLKTLPTDYFHCVVTSPPYYGLRSYDGDQDVIWDGDNSCEHEWGENVAPLKPGQVVQTKYTSCESVKNAQAGTRGCFCNKCGAWKGALGLEPNTELYINHLVDILSEVKNVLRPDGICWLNLGDSYAGSGKGATKNPDDGYNKGNRFVPNDSNLKGEVPPKNLMLIPHRVFLALQNRGWILRAVLPWLKRNAMTENVKDRPTTSIEYIAMLVKSPKYYYNTHAVKTSSRLFRSSDLMLSSLDSPYGLARDENGNPLMMDVNTYGVRESHFATYPPKLIMPLIQASTNKAGCCQLCGMQLERMNDKECYSRSCRCREGHGDSPVTVPCRVLDPFVGSGTTLMVCKQLNLHGTGIDLEYSDIAAKRIKTV